MKKIVFKGAGVAIVTPMHENGEIDYDTFGKLIEYQIENGTDAIIACGSTGEPATMTDQEHIDCIEFAVKKVNKRVPVIAGAGSNDTQYALDLSKEAKQLGCDALLHVTPYYNKCSQRGLVAHFEKIAAATDLPVILYNVPSRTGVDIAIDTYKELSKNENIVAVKEACGNISHIAQIFEACGDDLAVYSGNDDQTVPILSLGGIGVISVTSNIMPRQMHDICNLFFDGKVKESAQLQLKLLPLMNSLFIDVNPIPIKEAMNILGLNVGECRLPLCKMEDAKIDKLKFALKQQGLL